MPLKFSWDPGKSDENLRVRGFDFEFAARVFDEITLERTDTRHDYGERRVLAIGLVEGMEFTIVYTDRVHGRSLIERRIISARRSNQHERKAYQSRVEGR